MSVALEWGAPNAGTLEELYMMHPVRGGAEKGRLRDRGGVKEESERDRGGQQEAGTPCLPSN